MGLTLPLSRDERAELTRRQRIIQRSRSPMVVSSPPFP
jgi:hypothetical protein